jgi:polysaccharide pyruvyl transferase WcaK-like protein
MTASTTKLWSRRDGSGILRNHDNKANAGSPIALRERATRGRAGSPKKFAFFGHFDGTNFGNECSLQTILYHLRRLQPEADVTCICSGPQTTATTYHVRALSFTGVFRRRWTPRNPLTKVIRKIWVALRQPFQLARCFWILRSTELLIVPGTGLLTDAYGLRGWGPYGLLKWSLIAKACGCKVALVSVGAGPIHGTIGRWCIKLILSLAEFRSYRDVSTVRYLEKAGLVRDDAAVFPDLAFSLPECMIPHRNGAVAGRPVAGLGVMEYPGNYGAYGQAEAAYPEYLEALVESSKWLLDHGYDIRLLSGDSIDSHARRAFRRMLQERLVAYDCDRIIDEPPASVADALSQIALTDFVVATRFHNIIFGFLCGKPVISISFHHKCESLMATMGMSEYCLEMDGLTADRLIGALGRLEANVHTLRSSIMERTTEFREALDRQYDMLFGATQQEIRAAELITN